VCVGGRGAKLSFELVLLGLLVLLLCFLLLSSLLLLFLLPRHSSVR
jgi:hypothetical protein